MRSGTGKYALLFTCLILLSVQVTALSNGRITAVSLPSAAKVCVDDVKCDRTPADFSVSGNSWHNVTITAAGYRTWSDSVFVTAGQASLVSADLESNSPKNGVQVLVKPGGGLVCLDDSWCRRASAGAGGEGSAQFADVIEGFHTIKVNATEGYRTFSMVRYVTAKGISFSISLDPLSPLSPETGTLRVLVDHTGSTVCLDTTECHENVMGAYGSMTGTTDFSRVISAVQHNVTVTAEGYEPWGTRLTISPDQVNTIHAVLEPVMVRPAPPMVTTAPPPRPTRSGVLPARLTVESRPSSAKVCVDSMQCDFTPATFSVSGNAWHTVSVTGSGYEPWYGSIYMSAGQAGLASAGLQPVTPVPVLRVLVNPGGGQICLDDTLCQAAAGPPGGTVFLHVSEGFHTIRVNNTEGYKTFSVQRYVRSEGATVLAINLESVAPGVPETGTVRVSVNRYGSTICIDAASCRTNVGGTSGPGPGRADFTTIQAGILHNVTVTADGFEPWSANITVSPDQVNEVKVTLQPLAVVPVLQQGIVLPVIAPARTIVPQARISVISRPPYAHVCIDGTRCGTSPVEFAITGNIQHTVNITRSGYLDWSDTVVVPAGETRIVNASMQQDTGLNGIQIFVKPGGGTVCIDATECHQGVGTADSTGSTQFAGLDEGYHVVSVNATPGYQASTIRAYVPRRGFASITVTLEPVRAPGTEQATIPQGFMTVPPTTAIPSPASATQHGKLRVYVSPIGGTVCIDSGDCRDHVGGTPGPGTGFEDFPAVSAGVPHNVSVTEDGFLPASSQVTVSPDKASSVTFVLQPAPVTTAEPAPLPEPSPTPTRSDPGVMGTLGILAGIGGIRILRRNYEGP